MTYLIWLLRIVHIGAGVFWVGGALVTNFFIGPTVAATAEAGQKFMVHFMNQAGFSKRMSAAAGLCVLAGAGLYWIDAGGFMSPWMKSAAGTGFAIGALFGLVGFVCGILTGRNMGTLAKLAAQAQGKPSPEQLGQMQAIQKRQAVIGNLNAYSLIIAVIFMSVARYLHF